MLRRTSSGPFLVLAALSLAGCYSAHLLDGDGAPARVDGSVTLPDGAVIVSDAGPPRDGGPIVVDASPPPIDVGMPPPPIGVFDACLMGCGHAEACAGDMLECDRGCRDFMEAPLTPVCNDLLVDFFLCLSTMDCEWFFRGDLLESPCGGTARMLEATCGFEFGDGGGGMGGGGRPPRR